MAQLYRVQMMTHKSYHEYMMGEYFYHVTDLDILANSPEEARKIVEAKYPDMVVNKYVRTVAEVKAEEAEQEARFQEQLKKDEERKARRKANETRKAIEMGMTLTEYKSYQNRQRKVREYKRKIAEYEEEIAKMQAYITENEGK